MRLKVLAAFAFLAAMPCVAAIIDFESLAVGPIPGGTLLITAEGVDVTFSGPGLTIRQFGSPFPNTRVLSTTLDAGPITITFGGGFATSMVSFENIINGRFTPEVDSPIGTAYNALNNVVDMEQNSNTIHVLSGPGIVRVVYTEGSQGEGFVMDNFEFQVVPEPTTWILTGAGIGILAIVRRRR
jgi:hypothetical protein